MHRWCLLNLNVQGFSLNLTVRGVSNKHCLLTFFISPNFDFRSIIFPQFRPGAFSQSCWKKPWKNSKNPDEMPNSVAFHLDLHCLLRQNQF